MADQRMKAQKITITQAQEMLLNLTGEHYRIGIDPGVITYPARFMTKSELLDMKNPLLGRRMLERAEKFAPAGTVRKKNPMKRNSPFVYDTVLLEEWRKKH